MAQHLLGPVVYCPQSLVISCTVCILLVIPCTVCSLWSSVLSAVSGHPLYCVRSLWSSPVLYPQSLVISCTMSAVSGHPLYYVRSLCHPMYCPQSLVIPYTVFAVSGHLLYCIHSLWSSPLLSAVSGHL
ncbi:unnamed protein product, partial [Staurois parvus]